MAKASKMFVAAAAVAALCKLQGAFVPPPADRTMPVSTAAGAAGAAAMLGAAPAFAIGRMIPGVDEQRFETAAVRLSSASYEFLKEIDWTSDVYAKLPTQSPAEVIKAIDAMLKMGAAMDPEALKKGVVAHSRAIQDINDKNVPPLQDYVKINTAIGQMVASVPEKYTMDVYNAFAKFNLGKDVGPYMMSKVKQADAEKAYQAFLEFKDVVKSVQR